jgi:methylthioxylose transferase
MLDARALSFGRSRIRSDTWVRGGSARALAGVASWATLIGAAHAWGTRLLGRPEPDMDLNAPPLFGHVNPKLAIGVLLAAFVGVGIVVLGPRMAHLVAWRTLLFVAFAGSVVWTVSVAASEGWSALARPLQHPTDYLAALPLESPLDFIDGFVDGIDRLPLHAQSHPPGAVLLLWLLGAIGFPGAGIAAIVVVLAGASAVPAALLAVREIAGERLARRCCPFLVLAPAAVWVATSMDALFLGATAWGVALMIVATGRRGAIGDRLAAGGGILFGAALMLSYGVALLGLLVVYAGVLRRRIRPVLIGCVAAATVVAAFAIAGFWWLDGLAAATERYRAGISSARPGGYFFVANLAAIAVALGPAVAAALFVRWDKRLSLLVVPALMAIMLADLSGLSKGEVERIWLPFTPWLMSAAGALPGPPTAWLAAQASWTIMVQVGVQTPW